MNGQVKGANMLNDHQFEKDNFRALIEEENVDNVEQRLNVIDAFLEVEKHITLEELTEYALKRLASCPFQEGKTTCAKCPVHCYKPGMRKRVREVMREIGPRMIFHHPLMALRHLFDGMRKVPKKKD